MASNHPIVVFAAIDGLLESSTSEAFARAARELGSLAEDDVRLVLNSARTRAEIDRTYQLLQCRHPFTCEDGSHGMLLLGSLFRRAYGRMTSVGFADCASDGLLLNLVDHPVMIERSAGAFAPGAWLSGTAAIYDVAQLAATLRDIVGHVRRTEQAAAPLQYGVEAASACD